MYCFSNKGITPPVSPPVSFFDNNTSCSYYPALEFTSSLHLSQKIITIYPNPAITSLTITAPYPISQIAITNLLGQTIYIHEYNTEKIQINVADLPTGMYFIKINGSEVRKFVKQ
jgi:hypothetical protein